MQRANEVPFPRRARLAGLILDGLAVLAAILIAFGLDAWWGARAEQARTDALLLALDREWEAELTTLDWVIPALERNRLALAAQVEAHRTAQEGVSADSAAALMRGQVWRTYKPRVGALDALLLTDLDKVEDPALRAAIAAWPGVLETAEPQRTVLQEIGLVSVRRELSRVAESMGLPWSEVPEADWVPWGVPLEDLAPAAIRDPEVAVLYRQVSTVLFSYREQLVGIRETLNRSLMLLRQR